jgi:mannose-6-phosphate isomerase-like protein (cupin superfamily)
MAELRIVRLADATIVPFGPDAFYQPILGDDEGSTPIRTGIQTSEPGYAAPMHSHPYLEVLYVLEGIAEAWLEGAEDRKATLRAGDTIAFPPNAPHTFRVVGRERLRTLGTHLSPRRIVDYRDGGPTDTRGYRVWTGPSDPR